MSIKRGLDHTLDEKRKMYCIKQNEFILDKLINDFDNKLKICQNNKRKNLSIVTDKDRIYELEIKTEKLEEEIKILRKIIISNKDSSDAYWDSVIN